MAFALFIYFFRNEELLSGIVENGFSLLSVIKVGSAGSGTESGSYKMVNVSDPENVPDPARLSRSGSSDAVVLPQETILYSFI
jgi:hypothetical protein